MIMNDTYIMMIETRIDHIIQQVLVGATGVVDALADDTVEIPVVNPFTGNSYDRQYTDSAGEVVIE
jgi:hypothetical protein